MLYIDPLGEFSWSELKEKAADIGLGILAGSSDFGVNTLSGLFYLPAYVIDEVSYSLGYNLESRKKVMSIADGVRDYNASYYRQYAKSEKAFSTAQKTTRIVEEVGSLVLAVGATTKAIGAMGKAVKGGTALRAMQFSTGGTILIPSIEAGAIAAAAGRIAVFGGFGGIVYSSAGSSGCDKIPNKARDVANKVKSKNGTPPEGYKGGKTYNNKPVNGGQKLPDGVNYKEYDVNPYVKGQNRGPERIVIGDDGSVWYTNDHYHTFTPVK